MIQLIPSNDANTVFHFECYLFDYSPTNCRSERWLRTYFESVSGNNYHNIADMILIIHPMNPCFLIGCWLCWSSFDHPDRYYSIDDDAAHDPTVYVYLSSSHRYWYWYVYVHLIMFLFIRYWYIHQYFMIQFRFSNEEGSAVASTTFRSGRDCLLTKFYLQ